MWGFCDKQWLKSIEHLLSHEKLVETSGWWFPYSERFPKYLHMASDNVFISPMWPWTAYMRVNKRTKSNYSGILRVSSNRWFSMHIWRWLGAWMGMCKKDRTGFRSRFCPRIFIMQWKFWSFWIGHFSANPGSFIPANRLFSLWILHLQNRQSLFVTSILNESTLLCAQWF